MKTAILIPDLIFFEAEITAKELGLARSQLYNLVIKEVIQHYSKDRITEKLNRIFSKENNNTDLREATNNRSNIQTVIIASITTNLNLAHASDEIYIEPKESGLPKNGVINISQISTNDKQRLIEKVSR